MTAVSGQGPGRTIDDRVKRWKDTRRHDKRMEKQHQRFVEKQLRRAKVLEQMQKAETVWHMISGQSGGKVTSAGTERLLWLFRRVRRAEEIRMKIMELRVFEPSGSLAKLSGVDVSFIPALEREHKNLQRDINEFLKKHRLAPRTEFSYPISTETHRPKPGKNTWEALGAKYILEIAVSHDGKPAEILHFRNCQLASCGQLFYASASHQKFCTSQCRQAFFDKRPPAQRKRKERDQLKRYLISKEAAYIKEKGTRAWEMNSMPLQRRWETEWRQKQAVARKEERQGKEFRQYPTAKKETTQ